MGGTIKNIEIGQAVNLAAQVDWLPGQVTSKTLAQTPGAGLTLFAMPEGEGISAHKSSGDAFVLVLEGEMEITIGDAINKAGKGECIVMPAGVPHAVKALKNAKMALVVVFPARQEPSII